MVQMIGSVEQSRVRNAIFVFQLLAKYPNPAAPVLTTDAITAANTVEGFRNIFLNSGLFHTTDKDLRAAAVESTDEMAKLELFTDALLLNKTTLASVLALLTPYDPPGDILGYIPGKINFSGNTRYYGTILT